MINAGRKPYLDHSYFKDEFVQKWLVGLSERTKRNYLFGFKSWLDFINTTPSEQIKQRIQDTISQDLTQRNYFEDKWRAYKEYLEKKGDLKASSIQSALKIVASFFSRNSLPLNLKRGDWTTTQAQEVIKKWVLTNQEIRRMYAHANLRDRALLLVLYQSGFSSIDVCNLKIDGLDGLTENPETEHYFIQKPREKSNQIQATCLSFEAVHDIKAMLQERQETEGYLFTSQTKGKGEQINTRTINEAMKGLAVKTFGETKAEEFQTKNLRQSYNSALLRANIQPQELKDLLMGHARLSARKSYAYDEITIKEAYIKAFEFMTINGIQNRKDIEELRKAQITTAKTITQLAEENKEIKQELKQTRDSTQKAIDSMKKYIENIANKLEPLKDFGRDLTEEEAKELDKELEELEKAKKNKA